MTDLKSIPVVILAGGRGARFDHESQVKPKPMIEVVGQPILVHIIDGFIAQGFREFIVATGYLGDQIREYFASVWHGNKFSSDEGRGIQHTIHNGISGDPVFVKCYDTGEYSNTGDRVRKLKHVISERRFILTYGDGLADVDMSAVLNHHDYVRRMAADEVYLTDFEAPLVTMTAVRPPGRFGVLEMSLLGQWTSNANWVKSFDEKPAQGLINGGFMVIEPEFITKYLEPYGSLETEALHKLAADGLMHAVVHDGYWRCMDTRRDLEHIEQDVKDGEGKGLPWLREKK